MHRLSAWRPTLPASGGSRVGDMFALPFADNSFERCDELHGIWKGCEGALDEARRVLVPGGRLDLTFWGRMSTSASCPTSSTSSSCLLRTVGRPAWSRGHRRQGAMEGTLAATRFVLVSRGGVDVVNEWPPGPRDRRRQRLVRGSPLDDEQTPCSVVGIRGIIQSGTQGCPQPRPVSAHPDRVDNTGVCRPADAAEMIGAVRTVGPAIGRGPCRG